MIDIPEEKLLKEITDILMNDLPKVLLELEEQSEDGIRLPPFRYVGLEERLPVGTGLPYAFLAIGDATYTEKDRIIKNHIYRLSVMIRPKNEEFIQAYLYSCNQAMARHPPTMRIRLMEKKGNGILLYHIIT